MFVHYSSEACTSNLGSFILLRMIMLVWVKIRLKVINLGHPNFLIKMEIT